MIENKFNLYESVKIVPLDGTVGLIIGIWIAHKGIQYQVRYFSCGKSEEVYFIESELI